MESELKENEIIVKRPVGRPKKEKIVVESSEPKRKVGRPRTRPVTVKRKRGHPYLSDMVRNPERESKYLLKILRPDDEDQIYRWFTYDEIFDNYKDLESKIFDVLNIRLGKSTISQIINGIKPVGKYNNIIIVKK